jgi:polygalacturonase
VPAAPARRSRRIFDVAGFGAAGDGRADDTAALQSAVDACAAAGGGRVLLRGARWYRSGTIRLRDRVDLHLAEHAVLEMSLDQASYAEPALIVADGAAGVSVTGPGRIEGRATDFMTAWNDEAGTGAWIYTPAAWRPKVFALRACRDVTVSGVTMASAPFWGLHLLGCEHVVVEQFTVRNNLAVPNCDGVGIDHCRDVEVRDCSIHTGDDAVVVKTTAQPGRKDGPVAGVRVYDCELITQDSAVKIGTETTDDIRDVRFERCTVPSCNRACTIQLRDRGNVHDVVFADLTFDARYFSDPWWGHGEAVSVTAWPRDEQTDVGTVSGVTLRRLTGRSENSIRLDGSAASRLRDITLDQVRLTVDRWTSFPGGVYDNRPTTVLPGLMPHDTPGIHIAHADGVRLRDCSVGWGDNPPGYFSHAVAARDVTGLTLERFCARREAAGPDQVG